jgi:hypothetical protein
MSPSGSPDLMRACERVGDAVRAVLDSLDDVRRDAEALWTKSVHARSRPLSRDMADLAPTIKARLHRPDPRLNGAGVVFAPDALADATLFLEWWRLTGRDRITRLHLDFNPASERYYDYTPMRWFAIPRDERRPVVVGPYVDLHGADAYILTFGSPLVVDDTFVGIVGADVLLADFERPATGALRSIDADTVLVTDEDRVIASNTPRWTPGMLVHTDVEARGAERADVPCDAVAWSMIKLPTQAGRR